MFATLRVVCTLLTLCMLLAACGGNKLAPVTVVNAGSTERGSQHTVRKGETVYAIAFRYGYDYRDLASWNGLNAPYTIYPGQQLTLVGPAGAPASTSPAPRAVEKPVSKPAPSRRPSVTPSKPAPRPVPRTTQPKSTGPVVAKAPPKPSAPRKDDASRIDNARIGQWIWPTKGKVIGTFRKSGGKGINIEGRRAQPILAAHAGEIVYAGGGLIGYGELIIVKHNKRFLSAYAHNSAILVKEGDLVERGQTIARMGSSGTDRVRLHFEIRRDGKPVNPLRYLPR